MAGDPNFLKSPGIYNTDEYHDNPSTLELGATRDVIGPAEIVSDAENADHSSQFLCVSPLDDKSVSKKLLPQELQRWRRLAIIVCILSIFLTFLLSVASFISSTQSGSSATFAIAIDALLAIVSSSTVVWRFCFKFEVKDCYNRERRACLIIAVCFIISALCISIDSLLTLIEDTEPVQPESILILAIVNTVIYFLLFVVKYIIAEKLQSAALRADSFDAITGSATAFSVVISSIIVKEEAKAWFVDASVAQVIALFTMIYGVQLLVRVIRMKEDFRKPDEYQSSL